MCITCKVRKYVNQDVHVFLRKKQKYDIIKSRLCLCLIVYTFVFVKPKLFLAAFSAEISKPMLLSCYVFSTIYFVNLKNGDILL